VLNLHYLYCKSWGQVAANDRELLEALGVSPDDMDNDMVLVMSMFLSAAQGDTKAFDRVIQILGKDIAHEELALKKRELKLKEEFPGDNGFYSGYMDRWQDIYEGRPKWREVKRAGLNRGTVRQMNMLNTAKILCDEFSHKCFAEQVDITCGSEVYDTFIRDFLCREGFWKNIPRLLSSAFAQGGCVLREYIERGRVRLSFVEGRQFYPLKWDNRDITEGIFGTVSAKGKYYYTLFEKHSVKDDDILVECFLFRSSDPNAPGDRVPLSVLYPDMADTFTYAMDTPLFQYFKTDFPSNIPTELPLGISCFANCEDTLKALDVAFDSFAREFVLGKKRIIVPSSCIRTVVNPETGKTERYFDADDEVYQALKCDEDKDLKITDNTVTLRIQEHVDGINALLNILCFQVGLSPGSLSFDKAGGVKTATEVVSEENKTAVTIRCQKNLLVEFIEEMCRAVLRLAMITGEVPNGDLEVTVAFKDSVVIDDNTLIANNISLVTAGLKSKISAIMEVMKCDEEAARRELERINAESAVLGVSDGDGFVTSGGDAGDKGTV